MSWLAVLLVVLIVLGFTVHPPYWGVGYAFGGGGLTAILILVIVLTLLGRL